MTTKQKTNRQQIIEWKAQLSKQLNEATATAPETFNSFSEQSDYGKVAFSVNGDTGLDFSMTLFNHKETISKIADRVSHMSPKASVLGVARVTRSMRTALDEALAVYGTAENAYPSLKHQLENANALGLDNRQQQKLDHLVWTLEEHLIKKHGERDNQNIS